MGDIQTDKFLIKDNVTELTSETFSRSLAGEARQLLCQEGVLPQGFSVAFHNTSENSFTLGGWLPGRLPSKYTTATLFFDLGRHPIFSGERVFSHKDLCSMRAGVFKKRFGGTGDFVARTLEAARKEFDTVRYMRHWNEEYRITQLCQVLETRLADSQINGAKVGALSSSQFSTEAMMPVVIAGPGDVKIITQVLQSWLCGDCTALPSPAERLATPLREEAAYWKNMRSKGLYAKARTPEQVETLLLEPGFNERSACLYFDNIPLIVFSQRDGSICTSRGARTTGPHLMTFEGDHIMRNALLRFPGITYMPPDSQEAHRRV